MQGLKVCLLFKSFSRKYENLLKQLHHCSVMYVHSYKHPDRFWALTTELFHFKDNGCCSMGDEGRTCYPMLVHSAAGHTPGAGLREGSSSMDLLQERDQNTLRCLQFPERRLKKI